MQNDMNGRSFPNTAADKGAMAAGEAAEKKVRKAKRVRLVLFLFCGAVLLAAALTLYARLTAPMFPVLAAFVVLTLLVGRGISAWVYNRYIASIMDRELDPLQYLIAQEMLNGHRYHIAFAAYWMGDCQRAANICYGALKEVKREREAILWLTLLMNICILQGDLEQCRTLREKRQALLAKNPKTERRMLKGWSITDLLEGRYPQCFEAQEQCERQWLQRKASKKQGWTAVVLKFNRGLLHHHAGQEEESRAAFEEVIAMAPKTAYAAVAGRYQDGSFVPTAVTQTDAPVWDDERRKKRQKRLKKRKRAIAVLIVALALVLVCDIGLQTIYRKRMNEMDETVRLLLDDYYGKEWVDSRGIALVDRFDLYHDGEYSDNLAVVQDGDRLAVFLILVYVDSGEYLLKCCLDDWQWDAGEAEFRLFAGDPVRIGVADSRDELPNGTAAARRIRLDGESKYLYVTFLTNLTETE